MRSTEDEHKTHILFVHHGKGLGGAPLSLLYLIKGLDDRHYSKTVVFLHDSEVIQLYRAEKLTVIGPVNVMDFPHTKIWWLRWYHIGTIVRSIFDTLTTIFWVAPHILKQAKPDIVHLNTSSLIGWAIAAHRYNIPVAWHVREPLADGYCGIRKAMVRWCVKRFSNAIIPISHSDAKPWRHNSKTWVTHNAVDAHRFDAARSTQTFLAQHHLNHSSLKILFLGGLSAEKGTHIIVEAFRRIRSCHPEAQLLIAGNFNATVPKKHAVKRFLPATRFKQRVAQSVADLGSSVRLLGTIYDIPEAMAASSVIVFPATVGHFARPIIEAGFMKKPVIASRLAPLDELVLDEQTGFLVEATNYDAWAEKLCLLLCDQHLNKLMGQTGYQFCTQHFNVENHVSRIEHIYKSMLTKEIS